MKRAWDAIVSSAIIFRLVYILIRTIWTMSNGVGCTDNDSTDLAMKWLSESFPRRRGIIADTGFLLRYRSCSCAPRIYNTRAVTRWIINISLSFVFPHSSRRYGVNKARDKNRRKFRGDLVQMLSGATHLGTLYGISEWDEPNTLLQR